MESLVSRITGSMLINALDVSVSVERFFYRHRHILLYLVLALDAIYLCTILTFFRD